MASNIELALLLKNLHLAENNRDLRSLRCCLFEILHLSTNGCDASNALPSIVKLLAHSDVFIKRVAGELIAAYADRSPEMVLLATNTLVHDCGDLNPVVRSLGLKTLASLAKSLPSADVLNSAVSRGLEDSSGCVKQSAALACLNLHQVAPDAVTESGVWDCLYQRLSDQDPGTVAACLCALESIFAKEKGVVVSNKLAQYLISALPGYTSTVQRLVLQFLLKHSPKKRSQVFDHLNDLDEFLSASSSTPTVLCALELFGHLSSDLPKVKDKMYQAAWAALKVNLSRERGEEMVTSVLGYLSATNFPTKVIAPDYKTFFFRDDDALFLIKKKSCLLSKVIRPDNAGEILQEFLPMMKCLDPASLFEVLTNVSVHMGGKPEVEDILVGFLKQLIELGNTSVLETVVQILPTLTFCDESHWSTMATCLEANFKQITSAEAQTALLQLLRLHGSHFERAPEILEKMIAVVQELTENLKEKETSQQQHEPADGGEGCLRERRDLLQLRLSLLSAMVQVGLVRPVRLQNMLAKFMELCIVDESRTVRDRALFLYGFLYSKVKQKLASVELEASL